MLALAHQKIKNCLSLFCGIFLISTILSPCLALIKFQDAAFPELGTSGRALAMGNAFICKVDDSTSAFYNPAGLGTVRWAHLHLSNFMIQANRDVMNMSGGGSFTKSLSNFSKATGLDGQRQLLLDNRGDMVYERFQMMPNFTAKYFTMGYLVSKQLRSTLDKDPNAKFEYADRLDHGPYVALNLSLYGGVFKLGVSGIYLSRNELIKESDPNQALTWTGDDYNKGSAFIWTVGSRLTLPIAWLPTVAAVLHNASKAEFKGRAAGAPENIEQTLDVGFSITPILANFVYVHMEVDVKDLSNSYQDVTSSRKILAGIEFDFARRFFIRGGYGDGWGSGGLGLRTKALEVDLTTYAVDTTANAFRGREDRRFVLSLSSGI